MRENAYIEEDHLDSPYDVGVWTPAKTVVETDEEEPEGK